MIVVEPPSTSPAAAPFPALRKSELARFLTRAKRLTGLSGEVNLLLADDRRIRALNKTFRGKNKPTDVLSFPATENGEGLIGDLAISVDTAARQAAEHGHSLDEELRILSLHGLLHLAGHDHEADGGEMRSLEAELRAKLKLPVGLIERSSSVRRLPAAAQKRVAKKTASPKATSRGRAKDQR